MGRQREYTRFSTEATVVLKLEGEPSRSIKADLFDISFSGIGVYSPEKIEIDSEVKFELITKLLDRPILGKGKIRYIKETYINSTKVFKMGIEFVSVEKEAILGIINHLQRKISRSIKKSSDEEPFFGIGQF